MFHWLKFLRFEIFIAFSRILRLVRFGFDDYERVNYVLATCLYELSHFVCGVNLQA